MGKSWASEQRGWGRGDLKYISRGFRHSLSRYIVIKKKKKKLVITAYPAMVFCGFKEIKKFKLADPRLIYYTIFSVRYSSKKQFWKCAIGPPSCDERGGGQSSRPPSQKIYKWNELVNCSIIKLHRCRLFLWQLPNLRILTGLLFSCPNR